METINDITGVNCQGLCIIFHTFYVDKIDIIIILRTDDDRDFLG